MYTTCSEYCVQDGGPPRGARGGAPTFRGAGQVGVDFVDLGVPRGGAPLVLEKAGRVGLDFAQTETYCMFFSRKIMTYINCIFRSLFVVAVSRFFLSSCNLPATRAFISMPTY